MIVYSYWLIPHLDKALSPSTLSMTSPASIPEAAAGPPAVVAATTTFLVRGSSKSCTPMPAPLLPVAYAVRA